MAAPDPKVSIGDVRRFWAFVVADAWRYTRSHSTVATVASVLTLGLTLMLAWLLDVLERTDGQTVSAALAVGGAVLGGALVFLYGVFIAPARLAKRLREQASLAHRRASEAEQALQDHRLAAESRVDEGAVATRLLRISGQLERLAGVGEHFSNDERAPYSQGDIAEWTRQTEKFVRDELGDIAWDEITDFTGLTHTSHYGYAGRAQLLAQRLRAYARKCKDRARRDAI